MKFIKTKIIILGIIIASNHLHAQDHRFDPPWNTPPESKLNFTVPGVDNIPDLFGDITDPQLVVFFAGNQFMCVDDLITAFKTEHPQYQRIFVETLPPGILAKQIKYGSLVVGNLRIQLKPDIYTAGKGRIAQTPEWFTSTEIYAKNKLAIIVQKGNPKNIKGLKDLGRNDVRVSMPNPEWEGIGRQIEEAYIKAGGENLKNEIMNNKVKDSSTFLTHIHHRQSPMRILYNQSDAAPVWITEGNYQKMIGHPIESIKIPDSENIEVKYVAGQLKDAPHPQAAKDFMKFLVSNTAKKIYMKYGFETE
ncbi:MAG: substrate-binding domain-containing protein [Bacteroidota bacterium]|nr:substrate-binding domain-containing protein [Bacteroidota bacterium]